MARAPRVGADVAGQREAAPLSILFLLKHAGFVRNFESTIRLLARRGHRVHLGFQRDDSGKRVEAGYQAVVDALVAELPNVTQDLAPVRSPEGWGRLAIDTRRAENYLQYFSPRYSKAVKLRSRAKKHAPRPLLRAMRWRPVRSRIGLAALRYGVKVLAQAIPTCGEIDRYLAARRPDLVVVSPLVELNPTQGDYVRSARMLGIPTLYAMYSWDNLTNKGRINDPPDIVAVWNEAQKREIVDLHQLPAESVVVTGAPPYDQWFEASPSTSRTEFCGRVGLPSDRPIVLYVCSSPFIAPREVDFVGRWLRALRMSGLPALVRASVLVRPHPQHVAQWEGVDLADLGPVAIWPRGGHEPVSARARAEYFDSLYHASAVVGINTSALIESAILGRPVLTVLDDEFRLTQGGTVHFHHLVEVNGGLLHVAPSLAEHARQLEAALLDGRVGRERSRKFVEAYVRPLGIGVSATEQLVAAIERAGRGLALNAPDQSAVAVVIRALLRPIVARAGARP